MQHRPDGDRVASPHAANGNGGRRLTITCGNNNTADAVACMRLGPENGQSWTTTTRVFRRRPDRGGEHHAGDCRAGQQLHATTCNTATTGPRVALLADRAIAGNGYTTTSVRTSHGPASAERSRAARPGQF
jgi:hypothetical protein